MNEQDMEYFRNIKTSPGPGVGQSIDPTKPGPDADRIAELKQEIAELEAANKAAPGWGAAVGARWGTIKGLRAELDRLRGKPGSQKRQEIISEALHNLIVLARPHFSDDTQMLALKQAEDAIASLKQPNTKIHMDVWNVGEEAKRMERDVRAHLEIMAMQKLTDEMDEYVKVDADYEGAYNDLVKCARAALAQSDLLPREHQDPSKWVSREDMERAHVSARLIETITSGLNKLRAEASKRTTMPTREIFTLTDPMMDTLTRARPDASAGLIEVAEIILSQTQEATDGYRAYLRNNVTSSRALVRLTEEVKRARAERSAK